MKNKIGTFSNPGFKSTAIAILICLLGLAGAKAQDTKGEAVMSSQTVTATVKKINQTTREVTILTNDGQTFKFVAGPDVQNLAQVKKGDVITAVYTEALAFEIKKSK